MPRFLDTFSGQFIWIEDPSTVSYAILSHTWRSPQDGGEQTYTQVQEIRHRSRLARTEENPGSSPNVDAFLSNPELSDKIKGFCKVAREAGYRLVWIDACCIDKTSSAELAEAINSMFELYRLAEVCYVYLVDVPDGEDPYDSSSKFYRSRWHTRGWTLQEVIAPKRVVFLTATWTFLTTKMAIAATLADFTGIDVDILTGQATLATVSVARKMSWAARRETTRVEDEAYSLLGIFGIHLSPIYGEGHNAFLRLQEEIMRTVADYSIFAWGPRCTLRSLDGIVDLGSDTSCPSDSGLLAQSARSFLPAHSVDMLSPSEYESLFQEIWPSCGVLPPIISSVMTPQGVRLRLVCIDLPPKIVCAVLGGKSGDEHVPCEECLKLGQGSQLALLPCVDQRRCLITLPLQLKATSRDELTGARLATHARCARSGCLSRAPYRALRLGRRVWMALSNLVLPQAVDVTILHHEVFRPPTTRFDRTISIPLWPALDESPSDAHSRFENNGSIADIQLAPECAQVLSIAPLSIERSPDGKEIIVTTSFSTARGPNITIIRAPGRTGAGGASVLFAIDNLIYSAQPPSETGDTDKGKGTQDAEATTALDAHPFCPACSAGYYGYTRQPALGPIKFTDGDHQTVFDCSPLERVLAETEGVVLECRELGRHTGDEDDVVKSTLWLLVELSQTFYRDVELAKSVEENSVGKTSTEPPLPGAVYVPPPKRARPNNPRPDSTHMSKAPAALP
ncbi:heterokaryon incompatibility protein-domain-containing protein [Lenzites betulinus]|nr:heterokaryon incompatibility protein-domain-containing protein [Lenzites betulinus]